MTYYGVNDGGPLCQDVAGGLGASTNSATISYIPKVSVFASDTCDEDSEHWDYLLTHFDGDQWTIDAVILPFL